MTSFPSFKRPPVTEVVIATHFRGGDEIAPVRLGRLAEQLENRGFPRIERKLPYEPPIENVAAAVGEPSVSLEFVGELPRPRHWFLNDRGDEVLQVQSDWFACNWRKVTPEAEYGRWESRWNSFDDAYALVSSELWPGVAIDHRQVEVTYVNHIAPNAGWQTFEDVAKVFSTVAAPLDEADKFLPSPERTDIRQSFVIHVDDNPVGRLHAVITSSYRLPNPEPIFTMNLTARGAPLGAGIDGVRRFADVAHEWIVRSFAELTTATMHKAWEREP